MTDSKKTILDHLLEINKGECSITENVISAETDPTVKEVLAGLLFLHEDNQFRKDQAATSLRQLGESENRLSLQINQTPLGVIRWDTNFGVQEWNPAAESIFGFSREEALGRHACELIVSPDLRAQVNQVWLELVNKQGGEYVVNANNRKNGERIDCEWHNTALFDDDGVFVGVSSFVSDISDRVIADRALMDSEQRWQCLAAASFEGVLFHDGGIILDVNERLEQQFGYEYCELIGFNVLDLVSKENRPFVEKKLRSRSDGSYESTGKRKNGSEFPIEVSYKRVTYMGDTQRVVAIRDLSQYKQAVNAVREEKTRAELALSELAHQKLALDQHAIVAITDPAGIITYANKKFCEISGYRREELVGNTHRVISSGIHPSSFFKNMWDTISAGRVWHSEIVNRAKDGSLYWVDTTIAPFHGPDGKIQKYIAIRNDITAQKQIEQALRASEELFSTAFSASPALIAILEQDTSRYINVNEAWLELMEMDRADVIGKTATEVNTWVNPHDRVDYIASLERDGNVRDRQIKVRTKNGKLRNLLFAADIVEFAGKRCLMTVSLDIGERMKTEKLETRLGRVVEGSLNEIYIFDAETLRFSLVNKAALNNLGYSAAEMMGMTPIGITPEINRSEFEPTINRLRNSRRDEISYETKLMRKDGTMYDVAIRLNYLGNDTPKVFIAFVEDITDRKISEEIARRAQKIEAVGHLTGGIAHDFNNLLGIVLGNLDLLEEDLEARPDLMPLVETAQRAALRGSKMTKRLLSFSSKTVPRSISVNINDSIVSMTPLIERSLTQDIEIANELSDSLWNTSINDGDFEDAILNLAINASKAMPDGGKLTIKTENSDIQGRGVLSGGKIMAGQYVHLSVSDTGSGIADDVIGKIFDPFFTTDGKGAGTGLGLSMVYGFVERSGGTITVESSVGLGATFHIYLPRGTSLHNGDDVPNDDSELLPRGCETVLVVDDEIDLATVAENILSKLGYRVLTAKNAAQAMEIFDDSGAGEIDLLFSDIVMPGDMNGLELARSAMARRPALKVLMATGNMQKVKNADSFSDLTENLLLKPYSRADLARQVRAMLDGKSSGI